MPSIDLAIQAAGSQAELARLLGVLPQHITNWKARGIPADRCPAIENETGIACERLRADLAWVRDADGRVTGYQVQLASNDNDHSG